MSVKISNNFRTTLAAAVETGDTTFTVTSATHAPTLAIGDWCYVTVGYDGQSEILRCTARSGAVFTCPAFASDWPAGTAVRLGLTAEMLDELLAAQAPIDPGTILVSGGLTQHADAERITHSFGGLLVADTQGPQRAYLTLRGKMERFEL